MHIVCAFVDTNIFKTTHSLPLLIYIPGEYSSCRYGHSLSCATNQTTSYNLTIRAEPSVSPTL